jgi:hypothetical protein
MTEAKAIRRPDKPGTSRFVIQGLDNGASPKEWRQKQKTLCRVSHHGPPAKGLNRRFLRSQPRVFGLGCLRQARPRREQN